METSMPTVVAHHDVKDTKHWLASPKRKEIFVDTEDGKVKPVEPRAPGG
jgi:hypothetical protein